MGTENIVELIKLLTLLLEVMKTIGVPGILSLVLIYPVLIIMLWITHEREVRKILATYKADVDKVAKMYEKNVSLVMDGARREEIMQDLVIKNTEVLTNLNAELRGARK